MGSADATFRATLAGLTDLGGWLAEAGVTLVGMEATGVYWKTVFQALEEQFECWLLNAHHLRNVPGRKTDVKDSSGSASSSSTGWCARASCHHRRSAGCMI
jgi:transposase